MKIGICSDHAGYAYKTKLISYLLSKGHEVVNFGTDSPEACDYPDFAHPLACAVEKGEVERGIAICGTGNGMSITLNKHQGVRAGLAWNTKVARLVREHNYANILVTPARFATYQMTVMMVREYLATEFAEGRHVARVAKIPVK